MPTLFQSKQKYRHSQRDERGLDRRCDLPKLMPFWEPGLEPGSYKCPQHYLRCEGATGGQEKYTNHAALQCSYPAFLQWEADGIAAWFLCFPMNLLQAWLSRLMLEAVSSTSANCQSCNGNRSWLAMMLNIRLPCALLAAVLVGCSQGNKGYSCSQMQNGAFPSGAGIQR